MATKKITPNDILEISTELVIVRNDIADAEEQSRQHLANLKARRDELQAEVLALMEKSGVASVKSLGGQTVYRAVRKGLSIFNERAYNAFALQQGLVSPDNRAIASWANTHKEAPAGAEFVEHPYIGIKKPKGSGDDAE
jgi:hypothetical protein